MALRSTSATLKNFMKNLYRWSVLGLDVCRRFAPEGVGGVVRPVAVLPDADFFLVTHRRLWATCGYMLQA